MRLGCDSKPLNASRYAVGFRGLRRPARPTRSLRAPRRHGFDARAFARALTACGQNHVGPANVLSGDSRPPASTRRREPTVGQEAVSSRSRRRRLARSQRSLPRHGRLNTALCLSAEGVATTKQRFDRAVGPAAAHCRPNATAISAIFQRNKIAPMAQVLGK